MPQNHKLLIPQLAIYTLDSEELECCHKTVSDNDCTEQRYCVGSWSGSTV